MVLRGNKLLMWELASGRLVIFSDRTRDIFSAWIRDIFLWDKGQPFYLGKECLLCLDEGHVPCLGKETYSLLVERRPFLLCGGRQILLVIFICVVDMHKCCRYA